jgi:dissimilatory sulfite reductase (desulfoviridin) alpha/beta subunit
MGYTKERVKFEKLSTKVSGLTSYDDKNLTVITDIYEQYSHSIRILKNRNPEIFTDQYKNEFEEVKLLKRTLKEGEESDREDNFIKYRDSLFAALNSAITLIIGTA